MASTPGEFNEYSELLDSFASCMADLLRSAALWGLYHVALLQPNS